MKARWAKAKKAGEKRIVTLVPIPTELPRWVGDLLQKMIFIAAEEAEPAIAFNLHKL
jgi:hypothetical protein